MSTKKKRHGAGRGALIKPNRKVHMQHGNCNTFFSGSEFPPEVWRASAAYSLSQASRAKSSDELKYHLRHWVIRHACYMRGVHSNWPDYAWATFASAITASGLQIKFHRNDVRAICRMADRIARGEG
ncbi:hypothetical protein [Xanthomonas campestris]|uniref:hypothetical protein n=1 Tax=Xanthomonas campestris TaxID=339 RepID=UPI0009C1A174|nr:hypothetical protein [Xanthomonas campestris]MEB1153595.1 hypothetical protein [Xanthomonas campestris pv. campestris]MCC5099463.1 hypothetical protein [Xanthomonas campestris]MEA9585687.1 hypothetical protein [Xanthomonas campestris]MEA9594120.1 hypothetical protein [Xanthomonas campestris]MEA9625585.1 hypothetical protein [Xanthomonas campestris]